MSKFDYLKNIHEGLDSYAAYSGIDKLYKYVKDKNERPDISKKDVKHFLLQRDSYTKHGLIPRRFVRRPVKVARPGSILGSDIADLTDSIAKHNDGFRYILIFMDLFSRKVSLIPLKNKTSGNVAKALDSYLEESPYTFTHFFADEGQEYLGKAPQKIYDKYNIVRYNVFNRKFKNSYVERFIRTMKSFLFKYFTQNNTFRFLEILPNYQTIYNSTPHRGLGYQRPVDVFNLTDLEAIKKQERIQLTQKFKNYGHISKMELAKVSSKSSAFKVGGHVRILLNESERVFKKSYEQIFSNEIFTIRKVDDSLPVSYWLTDLLGRNISGVFYHKELQAVELPQQYYVEKIIKTRINPQTKKKEFYVKWSGWPDEYSSWVQKVYKLT